MTPPPPVVYEERYKDLVLHKLVMVHDPSGNLVQIEGYGETLGGIKKWVLLHVSPSCVVKSDQTED